MLALMRWHRLTALLLLTGCAGGGNCALVGCVSQLTVRLPAGVTQGQACVAGVCTSQVVDGALLVPLNRETAGGTVSVVVSLPEQGRSYEGEVPVTRTRPNGQDCPPVCLNGEAVVDPAQGRVVPATG